ncbi:Endospore appendages core domain-containing protein [Bacillus manliponensis]
MAADVTVILYTNNINQTVVGTGFIKYDVGPTDITVQVLDSTATIIDTQTLSPGSSLGFTYRQFNTIQVILPLATPGVYQGEFCITSRYPVS